MRDLQFYQILERIINGGLTINYNNNSLWIRDLTDYEITLIQDIFDTQYNKSVQAGLLSDESVLRRAINSGKWQEDWDIDALKKQKKMIADQIPLNRFKVEIVRKLRNDIKKLDEEINKLVKIYNSLFTADTARFLAYSSMVYKYIDFALNEKEFLATESDYFKLYNIISDYSINTSQIRAIARHPIWLRRYRLAKDGIALPIFNNVMQLTIYQDRLMLWTHLYEMAYNHPERPPDYIVEDDNAFDKWLDDTNKKSTQNSNEPKGQEVFVVADREGAKKVFDLNTSKGKQVVKKTLDLTKQKGKLTESERVKILGKPLVDK